MGSQTNAIDLEVLKRLTSLYKNDRLAHAYLFTGPKGCGKVETALAVAQAVNCQQPSGFKPGCGCASCQKMSDGNHPDLFIIKKPQDKSEILIGQITTRPNEPYQPLLPWLSVRALEAQVRVVIIKDADLFTDNAANAFLKTLEEPRPGTLFLLTSAAPDRIARTVISRCHEVRFQSLGHSVLTGGDKNEVENLLFDKAGLPGSSGVAGVRLPFLNRQVSAQKNGMIDEFILGPASEPLLKKWSADKEKARGLIDVIMLFYRDVVCVQGGDDSRLFNSDRLVDIHRIARSISNEHAHAVLGQAVKGIEALNQNFNLKVALTLLKEIISRGPLES